MFFESYWEKRSHHVTGSITKICKSATLILLLLDYFFSISSRLPRKMEKVTNWQQWKTAKKSGLNPNIIESMSGSGYSGPVLIVEKVLNKRTAEDGGAEQTIVTRMLHGNRRKIWTAKHLLKHLFLRKIKLTKFQIMKSKDC